jgi:hypothetical protein
VIFSLLELQYKLLQLKGKIPAEITSNGTKIFAMWITITDKFVPKYCGNFSENKTAFVTIFEQINLMKSVVK